jgi:hypothetical protein
MMSRQHYWHSIQRIPCGLADIGMSREMQNARRLILPDRVIQFSGIPQVSHDKRPPFDRPAVTRLQIVKCNRCNASRRQSFTRMAADISGASSHQYRGHGSDPDKQRSGNAEPSQKLLCDRVTA